MALTGSVFPLEPPAPGPLTKPPFASDSSVLTANATCGLFLLLEALRPKRVWLPSYLCPILIDGARAAATPVRFYGLDARLRPESTAFDALEAGDAVVVIHFFGWPSSIVEQVRAQHDRVFLIEDATQALLSADIGRLGDAVIHSPRKFLGVPDGGVLTLRQPDVALRPASAAAPSAWWDDQLGAAEGRRDFDDGLISDRGWFDRSQRAQRHHPIGSYAMSAHTRSVLWSPIDYGEIARRRRHNHQLLHGHLGDLALLGDLPASAVPMGYPVYTERRDRIREALFEAEIYPSIHWSIEAAVPTAFERSHLLASRILTLPLDQRYGETEMERMAAIVLRHAGA